MCSRECVWQKLSTKWRDSKLSWAPPGCTLTSLERWLGEAGETGNYPRLQLIHILSSVLAQGSRVIWECDRHTCAHTLAHSENESIWCMLDRFMALDYEHLTSPLGSCKPEPGWVQAVYSGWVGYLMPRSLALAAFFPPQPAGSRGSSFLTEND